MSTRILILIATLMFSSLTAAAELATKTHALDGSDITYHYTSGRAYHVKFAAAGISYQYLTGAKPEKWWGPFPYEAFEVEPQVFLASWFEAGYGDHVTLLINFNTRLLYGSALIGKDELHFHGARIVQVKRN